ncbi:MAG: bifunctional phosphopantothenoylcysteine decarboxylase/phosphopantothenate--cysteine ligase CoaBC [Actinobacteria bacterium]|nr:bifunctional phosphopantothenoylcysteine decarboxylase/phosphopantothenate--cysteine ligase CoaBC [Actinomycetota bacterium]
MPALAGRRVVLGVCGGIAAYKAVEVCRQLVDAGAHVVPVLTDDATRFIGEVTFSALASEPVRRSLWDDSDPIPHTTLGRGADLVLVAPATARLLSAYASGYSHDLLTNTLIATRAPVIVCPAMHTEMWEHPAVVDNLTLLRSRGVVVVEPESGRLAGGDVGPGRLADASSILAAVDDLFGTQQCDDLSGLRIVITAGGTREPIDPVRFLGNRSSGKQGHALAAAAVRRGATVTLITTAGGSRSVPTPPVDVLVEVDTAAEMLAAVRNHSPTVDVVVMAAAVADFTPVAPAGDKLKKRDGIPTIELQPTVDILAELGAQRIAGRTLVGFAAETNDVLASASAKLAEKGIDLIVVNDVSAPDVGFEHDTNEVRILGPDGEVDHVALRSKSAVADAVLDAVVAVRRPAGSS